MFNPVASSLNPYIILAARAIETAHHTREIQIDKYAAYSRLTLLAYDILLNLPREKRLVWDSKFRASSILYYMVRYPVIVYQVFNVSYIPGVTPHCDVWDKFTWAISLVLTRVAIVASFVLRVFAVTDRGILFVIILSLVGLFIVALDIWQDVDASCTQSSNPLSTVMTFISLVAFDVLATGLISWRVILVIFEQGGFGNNSSQSMTSLILRSGAIYYVVITGLQIGSIVLYFLPQGVYSTVLNNYTLLLSSILVARFLLDLRSMARRGQGYDGNGSLGGESTDVPTMMEFAAAAPPTSSDGHHTTFGGLIKDFEDSELTPWAVATVTSTKTKILSPGEEIASAAWPLEDLARRARRVEERLERGDGATV